MSVTCPICGLQMKGWSRTHLAVHHITGVEFQALRIEAEYGVPIADFLHTVYVEQRLSSPEIFKRYALTYRILRELLAANDIPLRTRSQAVKDQWLKDAGERAAATTARMIATNRRLLAIRPNISKRPDVRRKISETKKRTNPGLIPMLQALRQRRIDNPTVAEQTLLDALAAAGIPFDREYQVGRYFIDFAITEHKIAIECDGAGWHHRSAARDQRRDAWLSANGWCVFRYPAAAIRQDAAACVHDLVARLHGLGIDPTA